MKKLSIILIVLTILLSSCAITKAAPEVTPIPTVTLAPDTQKIQELQNEINQLTVENKRLQYDLQSKPTPTPTIVNNVVVVKSPSLEQLEELHASMVADYNNYIFAHSATGKTYDLVSGKEIDTDLPVLSDNDRKILNLWSTSISRLGEIVMEVNQ